MSSLLEAVLSQRLKTKSSLNIVQIGSNDGRISDPIYNFVMGRPRRTNLLLIEPQPELIRFLKQNYASHPSARIFNGAVGETDVLSLFRIKPSLWRHYRAHYMQDAPFYRAPSGFASASKEHVLRHAGQGQFSVSLPLEQCIEELKVPCRRLIDVMSELAFPRDIDLLQIDTEGCDDITLRACAVEELKPRNINFEIKHLDAKRLSQVAGHLESLGYRTTRWNENDMLASLEPSFQTLARPVTSSGGDKPKQIIVTGCDEAHFDLAEDLLESIRQTCGRRYAVGFARLCRSPLPEKIRRLSDIIVDCSGERDQFSSELGYYNAFVGIKPRMPDLFPGFDVYTWVDADCWVQNAATFGKVERNSEKYDLFVHPEIDIHYFKLPTPNDFTMFKYEKIFPSVSRTTMAHKPMFNSGVFSAHRTSRIWKLWGDSLSDLRARHVRGELNYFSDQIPLHLLIHSHNLSLFPLRATDNWQAYACAPCVNLRTRRLNLPTPPYEEISIIHLAGWAKDELFRGNGDHISLRRRAFLSYLERLPESSQARTIMLMPPASPKAATGSDRV